MRALARSCGVFALALRFSAEAGAATTPLPPKPTKYVTDRAGVVSALRRDALNERLAAFDRETSNQILVVVDRRLPAGTTLEEMGAAAIRAWGVGQKGRDNGVLFFVFVDERAMRVEVGYGLEAAIPDIVAKRITNDVVKPFFKRQDYTGGIEAGANALMAAARREGYKGKGTAVAPRAPPRPVMKRPVARPPASPSFPALWTFFGRTVAIGAGLAAIFLVAFYFVSRRSVSEEALMYGRTFMAAWGCGTAAVAAVQGEWMFAGIAFVVGLLFVIEYQSSGDGTSSSYESSSSSDYSSSSSSSYESTSSSSSSDFSGGGGDGGGGGSSDRW